jgi:hypothetical protein
MSRVTLVLLAALVACAKPKPVPIAPLPPDKPEPLPVAEEPKPAEPPAKPPEPTRPPIPAGPVEVSLPATKFTVKLVTPGKGKRAPLRYAAKQGAKQEVSVALDWSQTQSVDGKKPAPIVMPTIVMSGQGETTAVADGVATNVLTIASTDVLGDPKKAENFKSVLTSLAGMVITSTLAPGGAAGETTLRIDKPNEFTADALQLLVLTLPALPALPEEPVGVGAKWQATSAFRLAGKVEMTQVTDYEVTAHKGTSWTIKGTTKVMGVDQDVGDGTKITGIKGQGATEMTLAEGALYPTTKGTLETEFVAVDAESKLTIAQKTGASITPKTK